MAAKIPMMAMTTNNSINVNAFASLLNNLIVQLLRRLKASCFPQSLSSPILSHVATTSWLQHSHDSRIINEKTTAGHRLASAFLHNHKMRLRTVGGSCARDLNLRPFFRR